MTRSFVRTLVFTSALVLAGVGTAQAEPHPAIQAAIQQLDQALFILQHRAAHDFGGHRVVAIRQLQHARQQLILAERADVR